MSDTKRSDERGSASDDWQQYAAWAIELVHALARDPARRPVERMQQFADALAVRLAASATLTITSQDGGERNEVARIQSGPNIAAATHRLADALELPNGKSASITLLRASMPFSTVESTWLQILHAGCAWIYASSAVVPARRLADLSPREQEALGYLLRGASEKEVAASLGRSRHTVHSYVKRIYRTLGVRSRSELRAIFRDANGDAGLARHADPLTTSDD